MGNQRPDNADMGKSARGAAAQRQPDHRPPDAAKTHLVAAVRAVLAASDQNFQHLVPPGSEAIRCGLAPPECITSIVYAGLKVGLRRDCDWTATWE